VWAVMVMAFKDSDFFIFFPVKESFQAIGTKIFNRFAKTDINLEDV
jgi:hypothetical protein